MTQMMQQLPPLTILYRKKNFFLIMSIEKHENIHEELLK